MSKKLASGASAVIRTACMPNVIVALHRESTAAAAAVVTLDLCIRKADEKDGSGLLVKRMARDPDEAARATLERVRMLFSPPRQKGRTNREEMLATCPPVAVYGSPEPNPAALLDDSLTNGEFWEQARLLVIGDEQVAIRYNVPTITDIVPPSRPFVGLPLVCSNVTTVLTDAAGLHYEWCIHKDGAAKGGADALTVLSTDRAFVPPAELVGKRVVLRVTPDRSSGLWTQVELAEVQLPPAAVDRWAETSSFVAFPAFRTVSYNILYDDFATTKDSKTKIYPFATDEVLDIENRKVRILQELMAYHADIICLQECGKRLFSEYLLPAMAALGYGGFYQNKTGSVQEGCGLLYRTERFSLESTEPVPLSWDSIAVRDPALAARIAPHAELQEALSKVTTIGVAAILKEVSTDREVVVGNTHLFYHANACHIRIIQAYTFLTSLAAVASSGVASDGGRPRPVVMCGDCNFTHSTGAYRLVTTGQLEDTHPSWDKGKLFYWGTDKQLGVSEEQIAEIMAGNAPAQSVGGEAKKAKTDGVESAGGVLSRPAPSKVQRPPLTSCFHEALRAPLTLVDAYGRTDPGLPWTNFTLTFREVIDYILFSDDGIDVLRTIPIPPEAELAENYALPNTKYPSDHVALVADLTFKS